VAVVQAVTQVLAVQVGLVALLVHLAQAVLAVAVVM
jgi:hypothetical protein